MRATTVRPDGIAPIGPIFVIIIRRQTRMHTRGGFVPALVFSSTFAQRIRSSLAIVATVSCAIPRVLTAQSGGSALAREIDRRAPQLEAKAIAWRRDIHQHPELSNREVRTS